MSAIASTRNLPAAPLVCAALNLAAALVLASILAPGTPLASPAERSLYVSAHQLEWRLGWSVWIAAALSLLWFYWWWRERVGAHSGVLLVAALAFVADLTAESLLILYLETSSYLPWTLTGGVANGLYTICGIALTLSTPLMRPEVAWAAAMWTAGIALSVAAFAGAHAATAVATGVLFALFCPWCAYLAVKLR